MPSSVDPVLIGGIVVIVIVVTAVATYFVFSSKPKAILPLEDFIPCPLTKKEILSHDSVRFTFALPSPTAILGLPTGQHINLRFTDPTDKQVHQRSYTPVSDDTTIGSFVLVVKIYKPNPPKFPEGGKMSQHLDSLKIGDTILMKGPKGHMHYRTNGEFSVKPLGKPKEERKCVQIGMMAGGTGITPMLQVLNAIVRNPKENHKIKIKLIYANQTEDDILVRNELEIIQKDHPDRFSLWYTVDRSVTKDWNYSIGFITKEMVESHLMFENKSIPTQFLMCGPPPMIKFACQPALKELGYSEKDWVVF